MHVVAHQTIRPDRQAVPTRVLAEKRQVSSAILIVEKDIRPPIAALCDVMRTPAP